MIYFRAALALLGAALVVFSAVRIVWEFVHWSVKSLTMQVPFMPEGDPRIRYRQEAIALAVGLALFFLAAILK